MIISDEEALLNQGMTITKKSLYFSNEYIIYPGTNDSKECIVKIVVLSDRPCSYRNSIQKYSKVARWLMSRNNDEPRHPRFVKLYNFFLSGNKTYSFMKVCSTVNLELRARDRKIFRWRKLLLSRPQLMIRPNVPS